ALRRRARACVRRFCLPGGCRDTPVGSRLVEVSDDAIGELDLVKRLTVDRHCSGDLRGSSGELRADGFDGVDQRRRLGAWLLVDRLRARVARVVDRAFSRTFVELTEVPLMIRITYRGFVSCHHSTETGVPTGCTPASLTCTMRLAGGLIARATCARTAAFADD